MPILGAGVRRVKTFHEVLKLWREKTSPANPAVIGVRTRLGSPRSVAIHSRERAIFTATHVTQKTRTEVELTLADGRLLAGVLFTHAEQRVLDIVNDDRAFIPFEDADGQLTVINKSMIAHIRPMESTSSRGELRAVAAG